MYIGTKMMTKRDIVREIIKHGCKKTEKQLMRMNYASLQKLERETVNNDPEFQAFFEFVDNLEIK